MDTLSDAPARAAAAGGALPRILRDDGPVAKRLPAVVGSLSRAWQRYAPDAEDRPRWGYLWAVLLLAASTIYLVGRDGGRPRGAAFLREGLWEQLDWLWPLLLGAAAIAAGVLHAEVIPRAMSSASRWMAVTVPLGAGILAVFAATGAVVQQTSPTPWDLPLTTQRVLGGLDAGDIDAAHEALRDGQRWNPRASDVVMAAALVSYAEGRSPASEVVDAINPRGVRFPTQTRVATYLLDTGEVDAADSVLTALRPHLEWRPPGEQPGRRASFLLELAVTEVRQGCGMAQQLWETDLRERVRQAGVDVDRLLDDWLRTGVDACS